MTPGKRIEWTSKMDSLLGEMHDQEAGGLLNIPKSTVAYRRRRLGIRAFGRIKWTSEMDTLLGTMTDMDIAKQFGISQHSVSQRRKKMGLPTFWSSIRVEWTQELRGLLGTMPDQEIADFLGTHEKIVFNLRHELNIESHREQNRVIPKGMSSKSLEAGRLYEARRKHKKLELADTLTYEQWLYACEYFDDRCAYCGQRAFLTEDHLVPVSKGGPRTAMNIVPCCVTCNCSKNAKQAHVWIKERFGREESEEIEANIVAYLKEICQ